MAGLDLLALLGTGILAGFVSVVASLASVVSYPVAGIGFAIFGPVRWTAVVPLAAGFLIGGWIGPPVVRRLPARGLRIFIGGCGLALAIRLAYGTYT